MATKNIFMFSISTFVMSGKQLIDASKPAEMLCSSGMAFKVYFYCTLAVLYWLYCTLAVLYCTPKSLLYLVACLIIVSSDLCFSNRFK